MKYAVHKIQGDILDLMQKKDINKLSLRKLGEETGNKLSPQQMNHHLSQLIKHGFVDIIKGEKRINKDILVILKK